MYSFWLCTAADALDSMGVLQSNLLSPKGKAW